MYWNYTLLCLENQLFSHLIKAYSFDRIITDLPAKSLFWSSEVGPFGEVYFYSVSSHLDDVLEDFGNGKYDHSIKDFGYSCRCVKDE